MPVCLHLLDLESSVALTQQMVPLAFSVTKPCMETDTALGLPLPAFGQFPPAYRLPESLVHPSPVTVLFS